MENDNKRKEHSKKMEHTARRHALENGYEITFER